MNHTRYSASQQEATFSVAALIVAVAFLAQMDASYGLDCNICVASKSHSGPCRVMPCNSAEEVANSNEELSKHQGFDGELPSVIPEAKEFVCVRTLGRTTPGGPPDYVYSLCAPGMLLPSENPYPKSAMGTLVYVCDEMTGNGPNCGEKADVSLANSKEKK